MTLNQEGISVSQNHNAGHASPEHFMRKINGISNACAVKIANLNIILAVVSGPSNDIFGARALFQKAIDLAEVDAKYRSKMEETMLNGSTLEIRELFSEFGEYFSPPRETFPWYPHTDAVNAIDSAFGILKVTDYNEHIEFIRLMRNLPPLSEPLLLH